MKPMLANALDISDIPRKAKGYWMEPKLDGVRCLAAWDGRMISRSAKTDLAAKLPHLSSTVRALNLPQGVWLDGEVGYFRTLHNDWPIFDFNKTMRVVGSGAETAISKQGSSSDPIYFWVFDFIDTISGIEYSQAERSWELMRRLRADTSGLVHQVMQHDSWDEDIYNSYVMAGGEGVILKNPSALYHPGKRPTKVWYKIKKFESFEGRLGGFVEGKGKYEGQVGALWVEHPDGFVVKCSGMDDAMRMYMTENWQEYLGHYVEVKYFGNVGQDGTGIRHPQFLRMRPDLD